MGLFSFSCQGEPVRNFSNAPALSENFRQKKRLYQPFCQKCFHRDANLSCAVPLYFMDRFLPCARRRLLPCKRTQRLSPFYGGRSVCAYAAVVNLPSPAFGQPLRGQFAFSLRLSRTVRQFSDFRSKGTTPHLRVFQLCLAYHSVRPFARGKFNQLN